MRTIHGVALFLAGVVVGSLGMQSLVAQQNRSNHRINHVGIRVKDYQQSLDYYTKVLGFKEAYRFPSPNGAPTTTFLQVSKDTFIELNSDPQVPWGVTHYGLWVDDTKAAVDMFRQRGVMVTPISCSAAMAKPMLRSSVCERATQKPPTTMPAAPQSM